MKLNLQNVEDFPAEVIIEAKAGEFEPFAPEVTAVNNVVVRVAIQKSQDEYFCQGSVDATYSVECARCLTEFESSASQALDFIVCSEETWKERRAAAIDDEEYAVYEGGDMVADISQPVREALILSLEMKPLCSETCRGLCPICGTNRNERSCNCKQEDIDPRWEGLRRLAGRDR
jgi:uncharacterized protein